MFRTHIGKPEVVPLSRHGGEVNQPYCGYGWNRRRCPDNRGDRQSINRLCLLV